jgi:hydroxymethylpyrimidine/phosphomethylpyrimidine kinase
MRRRSTRSGALLDRAMVATPNLPELEALGGEEAVLAHGCSLLVKGGHAEGETVIDRLLGPMGEIACWTGSRIHSRHTHGTGCTLSSAIALGLGGGLSLTDAVLQARDYVRAAMLAAPGLGQGHGPMGTRSVFLIFVVRALAGMTQEGCDERRA